MYEDGRCGGSSATHVSNDFRTNTVLRLLASPRSARNWAAQVHSTKYKLARYLTGLEPDVLHHNATV